MTDQAIDTQYSSAGGWRALLLVVAVGTTLAVLGASSSSVVSPRVAAGLLLASWQSDLFAVVYLAGLALAVPLSGTFTDRLGVRRAWVSSVFLFGVGSLLVAGAWNGWSIVAGRLVQALGAGLVLPIGQAIVVRASPPERVSRSLSTLSLANLVGPAAGALVVGVLVDLGGWRLPFLLTAASCGAVCLAVRLIPAWIAESSVQRPWDPVALLLLAAGTGLLIVPLSGFGPLLSPVTAFVGASGLLLLSIMVVRSFRQGERTMLDLSLLASSEALRATVISATFGAGMFGGLFVVPLIWEAAGAGTAQASASLLWQSVGSGISLLLLQILGGRLRLMPIIAAGCALSAAGAAVVAVLPVTTGWTECGLLIRGIGLSLTLTPSLTIGYRSLTREVVSRATTVFMTALRWGAMLGTALVAIVWQVGSRAGGPQLGASCSFVLLAAFSLTGAIAIVWRVRPLS